MAIWQGRSVRKATGARAKSNRNKRKMEFGGDARISTGSDAPVGPVFYYIAPETNVTGALLKMWSETSTNKTKYEYVEGSGTPEADGLTWFAASGGNKTTMLTNVPT